MSSSGSLSGVSGMEGALWFFMPSNGAGTGVRGWWGAGRMKSSCPGQGGSATGHRSHLLTLTVLAAQSPVGLEHSVEEGQSTVRTCYCDVAGNPARQRW